ncbi:hypothetical protein B296_00031160 [Ensete ventricosum]|uniref:Uncharacterized protein n=1 Tax=Ensete ventricosum TaxID=4639 RepID=A0A427A026_ENSVE|nr:hypothetical protein B296_00031160 [Ensete ventricosum]
MEEESGEREYQQGSHGGEAEGGVAPQVRVGDKRPKDGGQVGRPVEHVEAGGRRDTAQVEHHRQRTDDEWHGFPAPVLDKRLAEGRRAALRGLHCCLWLFSLPLPPCAPLRSHTTER